MATQNVLGRWNPADAAEDITRGMGVDYSGAKASTGEQIAGVAEFDVNSGYGCDLVWGRVYVLTSAAVAIGAEITIGATAGKFRTAVAGERVLGRMAETAGGAGTYLADIYPPGVGAVSLGFPSGMGAVGQIPDGQSAYVPLSSAAQVAATITSVTVRFAAAIVAGGTGVIADLYRVRAGTATKIYTKTAFTAVDYVAWADWALTVEAGAGNNALVAGDQLFLVVTNNTGIAIDPALAAVAFA
jgi:hypothetical protein